MKKTGIYNSISIEEYHADEGLSASGVNLMLDCPKRYYHRYLDRTADFSSTEAQNIGNAVHMLSLEPEKFRQTYCVMNEKFDRRTKAGKEAFDAFKKSAAGRVILALEDFEQIAGMADAVNNHPLWKRFKDGCVEYSLYWDLETGVRLRSRPDYYTDEVIIDLKTTSSVKGFDKSALRYGYHRQAAMQIDGLKALTGLERMYVLFAVEKEPPYLTACYTLDVSAVEAGRQDYLKAAKMYRDCKELDIWPGYGTDVQTIKLEGDGL